MHIQMVRKLFRHPSWAHLVIMVALLALSVVIGAGLALAVRGDSVTSPAGIDDSVQIASTFGEAVVLPVTTPSYNVWSSVPVTHAYGFWAHAPDSVVGVISWTLVGSITIITLMTTYLVIGYDPFDFRRGPRRELRRLLSRLRAMTRPDAIAFGRIALNSVVRTALFTSTGLTVGATTILLAIGLGLITVPMLVLVTIITLATLLGVLSTFIITVRPQLFQLSPNWGRTGRGKLDSVFSLLHLGLHGTARSAGEMGGLVRNTNAGALLRSRLLEGQFLTVEGNVNCQLATDVTSASSRGQPDTVELLRETTTRRRTVTFGLQAI